MRLIVEKEGPTQISITVSVPYPELEPLLAKAAEKLSNEVEIEGFRKGKAPYEIIKQRVGEFKILEEAARSYIYKNFSKILEEVKSKEFKDKSFEVIGEPKVAITKLALGEDLEYKINLSILPPVELPDYKAAAKKILSGKKVSEVTEEEVESSKKWLCESRSKLITVNRAAQKGDRVEIDYIGKLGGIKLEGLESKNHPLILGQSRFAPGFDEMIIGMKAGDEKTFYLTIPADYNAKDIAGKNIEFDTKVNLVQERQLPEWNDDFARMLGNFSSAQAAEGSIRDGLKSEKEHREKERIRMSIIEAVAEATRAEIPEALVDNELVKMIAELENSIAKMGLKFEDYLQHIKKTPEDLKKEWRKDASKRVKIALALREIARKENIVPSDAEIEEAAIKSTNHQGLTEEEIKTIDREAFINYNRGVARNEKVFKFLENLR